MYKPCILLKIEGAQNVELFILHQINTNDPRF